MENQVTRDADKETRDELSWQFILLAAALALLVPLINAAPITIERAPRPVSLSELELTDSYQDVSGVSMEYPGDWTVQELEPGNFLVSNYTDAISEAPEGEQMAIFVRHVALADVGLEAGSTAYDVLLSIATQVGIPEDQVVEFTLDGHPAARAHFVQQGLDIELVLATPDENTLVLVESNVEQGTWDKALDIFDRMLETITVPVEGE